MEKQTNLSTLSLAILGLISQGARSGYDVRQVFTSTPMGYFSKSPGAIYPALERMEQSGLIKGRVENVETLRPRKVYTLTEEGREALRYRLSQPVTYEDVAWHLDDLLLRFSFMEGVLGRPEMRHFLTEFLSQAEAQVETFKELLAALEGTAFLNGRLVLEHGIEQFRATARWGRRAIKELQGD